jgi:hypothetical protein
MGPVVTLDLSKGASVVSVPRLRDDGANWVHYENMVQTVLGAKGLTRHIVGTSRKPVPFKLENDIPV